MKILRHLGGLLIVIAAGCAGTVPPPPDLSKYVWPPPPAEAKIRLIKYIVSDFDIRTPTTAEMLLGEEYTFTFGKPHGIAVDREGYIYVTDTWRRTVDIINYEKGYLGTLDNAYGWKTPLWIAVDDDNGLIAVADGGQKNVYIFAKGNKKLLYVLGQKGEFVNPSGVAFVPHKRILYVSDSRGHVIFAYNSPDGKFIKKIAEGGMDPGQVYYPAQMATDREGKLYVVDSLNFRLQVFDADGNFLTVFGEHGDRPGMFARPKGVAVSYDNLIFVTDSAFGNFQIFDIKGNVYLYVGVSGKGLGMFSIPQGIAIDEKDRIYVVDQINRRLQIFQYLSERFKKAEAQMPAPSEQKK